MREVPPTGSIDDEHLMQLWPLQTAQNDRLKPAAVVSHIMPLTEAARGYKMFNDKSGSLLLATAL